MRARNTIRGRRREAGIALLISIFVLLLISVVAIALIVSSGTESALAGNYRSSTGVYYAALSGLEEARGRLLARNPDSFKSTDPAFLPTPGTPLAIGSVAYVLNPGPTELMANILTSYPDTEYENEFGPGALTAATVTTTKSVWNRSPLDSLNVPGPLYKWVRINAVSENSLKLDVDADNLADSITPLYYDGTHFSNSSSVGPQVLEITSLAALSNGSQKVVQYLVAPVPITLPPFLAALTLSGSNGSGNPVFQAPANNNSYAVKGDGWDCNGSPAGPPVRAIGIYGDYPGSSYNPAVTGIKNGIPPSPPSIRGNYTGQAGAPNVEYLNAFQTPSQLNALAQTIIQYADAVVPAGSAATQTAYMTSLGMSPSNMMTVVRNGDLDLTHWGNTGYGLLLVTGDFTMDPDNGWRGIILVIGNGKINNTDDGGSREIDGAVFVAKTNLPDPDLGAASVVFRDNMGSTGIRYSNCWIQKAQPVGSYKVLSFHEIPQ